MSPSRPTPPRRPTRRAPRTSGGEAAPSRLRGVYHLLTSHGAEVVHARCVAAHATDLFRATRRWHGLDESWVTVLEAAALLACVGIGGAGGARDIRALVLEGGVEGFDADQSLVIALVAGWQGGGGTDRRGDALLRRQRVAVREVATRLAAIVRVAEALDHARVPGARLGEAMETNAGVAIRLSGGDEAALGVCLDRAARRVDLWNASMTVPLLVVGPGHEVRPGPFVSLRSTMREAGARVIRHHLGRLEALVPAVCSGTDAEAIHQARVATRRMRAALKVFRRDMGGREALAPWNEELRWVAQGLGAVRDIDVFFEWLDVQLVDAPLSHVNAFQRVVRHFQAERAPHLAAMVEQVNSERFRLLLEGLGRFLDELALRPRRRGERLVAEGAPRRVRRAFREVLAHQAALASSPTPEALHETRIAFKRLRYAAEFFKPAYGTMLDLMIAQAIAAQDLLGTLNDLDMHTRRLRDFVSNRQSSGSRVLSKGLEALTSRAEKNKDVLRREFQPLWQSVTSAPHAKAMDRLVRDMAKAR